jgi:hypothetical protein
MKTKNSVNVTKFGEMLQLVIRKKERKKEFVSINIAVFV